MGLRSGQRELVEQYRKGFCAVPAIPGGGKTFCLSVWVSRIIAEGLHKPGKVLIVTYMNSAVSNFKQRISNELEKVGITSRKDYTVSTIHSLCLQIVREKPDIISANEEFDVLDDTYRIKLINQSIDEWKSQNQTRFTSFINDSYLSSNKISYSYKEWQKCLCETVRASIANFKSLGLNPSEAKEKFRDSNSLLVCVTEIYEIYDRKIKIFGAIDFDDILYKAKHILSNDISILEQYKKKYTYICEDEAQDSNIVQNDILSMISNNNILKVGDSNQAICGTFSNSDFRLFNNFCNLPNTQIYNITESSRSTCQIIDLANYFVEFVTKRHPVSQCHDALLPQFIKPVNDNVECMNPRVDGSGIEFNISSSEHEEYESIAIQAADIIRNNPNKTIAILSPNGKKIDAILKILESKHIPFEHLDNTSEEKNKTARCLGRILDFVSSPEDGSKLADMIIECMLCDKTFDNLDQFRYFLKNSHTEDILYPVAGEINTNTIPEAVLESEIWSHFISKLDFIRELLEFPQFVIEKLILYIAEKLNFCEQEWAIAQKIAGDIKYLMKQVPKWQLNVLAEELLKSKNMFNFFSGVVWELKGYVPRSGIVTVSTYHKAKGLEWDVVFLSGLTGYDFPVYLSDKILREYRFLKKEYQNPSTLIMQWLCENKDGLKKDFVLEAKIQIISEKARLLYVGITRAKEYLYLSAYQSSNRNGATVSDYFSQLKKYVEENNYAKA